MKLKFSIIFIIFSISIYAQNIKGKVIDKKNEPIDVATVVIYDFSNKIIAYTTTDFNGTFKFNLKSNQKVNKIVVSCIGFATQEVEVLNKFDINVILNEEIFILKEVEIVSKILKDTVDIKIIENLTEQSSLKDILEKNNELQISENGTIFYEGKPINKILINKKEVFINQNNIALNNITKEMIEKVQIINNYKDKFSFNFEGERNSVINIDTKNNFMGVLKNNIEASGGYLNKYNAKLKSMFFSDKLNVFFTNNSNNILDRDFKFENNNTEVQNGCTTKFTLI